MKKTYVNKKAITIFEILLAITLISIVSSYIITQILHARYSSSVTDTQNQLTQIIRDGIIGENSYSTRKGNSDCSQDADFTGLTTSTLVNCMEWSSRFSVDTTAPITWGKMTPLTNELMRDYGSCTFEVRMVPTLRREFEVFVDCSEVSYNQRSTELLEDAVKFVFEKNFSNILVNIDDNAESMTDTAILGDTTDGLIRGRFRL